MFYDYLVLSIFLSSLVIHIICQLSLYNLSSVLSSCPFLSLFSPVFLYWFKILFFAFNFLQCQVYCLLLSKEISCSMHRLLADSSDSANASFPLQVWDQATQMHIRIWPIGSILDKQTLVLTKKMVCRLPKKFWGK